MVSSVHSIRPTQSQIAGNIDSPVNDDNGVIHFNSLKEKNVILNLNSVQMGDKTLYLMFQMEGSQFKKNVINKVSWP